MNRYIYAILFALLVFLACVAYIQATSTTPISNSTVIVQVAPKTTTTPKAVPTPVKVVPKVTPTEVIVSVAPTAVVTTMEDDYQAAQARQDARNLASATATPTETQTDNTDITVDNSQGDTQPTPTEKVTPKEPTEYVVRSDGTIFVGKDQAGRHYHLEPL